MRTLVVSCAMMTCLFGQAPTLYIIAGSPTPKYASNYATVLAAIGDDGSVAVSQEIVPRTVGTEWTSLSYDDRKAVILAKAPQDLIIVVDFDAAAVTKSCRAPDGTELVGNWLSRSVARGLTFVGFGTNATTGENEFLSMNADSGDVNRAFRRSE